MSYRLLDSDVVLHRREEPAPRECGKVPAIPAYSQTPACPIKACFSLRNFSTSAPFPELRSLIMTSLVTGLRHIILHHSKIGTTITRSAEVIVTSKKDIHTVIYKNLKDLNTEELQKQAFDAAVLFSSLTGLDDEGAETAEIALVHFYHTLCCLQSDQSCLAEVSTIRDLVLTSFGV